MLGPDRIESRSILSFSVGPLVNMLTPFLVLPVLATSTDTSGWAELAVGQSTGSVAAGLVAYGWQIVGPVEAARSASSVGRLYAESLVVRLTVLMPTLAVVLAVCLARAPSEHPFLAAGVGGAVTLVGLSPSWVAIGLGRPMVIVLCEALPRVVLLTVSAILIALGGTIWLYPAALAASTVVGLLIFSWRIVRPIWEDTWYRIARRRLRSLGPTTAATTASSFYSTGALLLVGLVASTQSTAEMASADRLFRIGLVVIVVLANGLQAWVVNGTAMGSRSRQLQALRLHLIVGVAGWMVFAVAAPETARMLFGESLAPDYVVTTMYGAAFAFQAVQISLVQHVLIPAGRDRAVLASTLAGAAFGVPALLLLAEHAGSEGGAIALAGSEGLVMVLLAVFAYRLARNGAVINARHSELTE